MKWYERQKQLYAQRNLPKNDSVEENEKEESTYQQTHEPTEKYQESYQEAYAEEYETTYDEIIEDDDDEDYAFNDLDYDTTIINKGSILTGNIESDNDLIIHGHVKGDIICNANLSVYGVVEGHVQCGNAYFDNAIIVGNIGCSGSLQLTQSSTVDGNVEAYELMNGGRIKGNAIISEGVRFLSTSVIVGDIDANDIEIERGAVIQGSVTIRQEVYFEK